MITELLLLDIETVPQYPSFAGMDSNWQSLFHDKVAKIVPEDMDPEEGYRKKAGILAEFGKIVCICTAFFYEDENKGLSLKMKSIYGDDEVEILRNFTDLCNKMHQHNRQFQFAGHNIKEFDIPYICRRLLINRLPLPEYLQLHDKKPWEVNHIDTLELWKFGDFKNYTSLNLLAHTLDISTPKDDIDGSMVWEVYWNEQNLQRIVTYCQKDVITLAQVYLRMNAITFVKQNNIEIKQ